MHGGHVEQERRFEDHAGHAGIHDVQGVGEGVGEGVPHAGIHGVQGQCDGA